VKRYPPLAGAAQSRGYIIFCFTHHATNIRISFSPGAASEKGASVKTSSNLDFIGKYFLMNNHNNNKNNKGDLSKKLRSSLERARLKFCVPAKELLNHAKSKS
jgi:hypothetical protein